MTSVKTRGRTSARLLAPLPETMRAIAIDEFGPPSVMRLHELEVPRPKSHEVLIALEWAGVGSWDGSIRDGSWKLSARPKFPLIPGVDGAGIVVAAGTRVRRVRIGDRVYAYESGNPQGGFYAPFALARAEHVDRVPDAVDTRDAAAVVTTGLTALQGINLLRLRRGSVVMVFGASGAVGTIAVQLAKRHGATVLATVSGRAASRIVGRLGADHVVDARSRDATDRIDELAPEGLDAVLALAGGEELERVLALVRPGGRVAHPNGIEPEPKRRAGIIVRAYDAVADPRRFTSLRRELEAGEVRVPIAGVFPLSQAARAHRKLAKGHVVGRIVLRIPRA